MYICVHMSIGLICIDHLFMIYLLSICIIYFSIPAYQSIYHLFIYLYHIFISSAYLSLSSINYIYIYHIYFSLIFTISAYHLSSLSINLSSLFAYLYHLCLLSIYLWIYVSIYVCIYLSIIYQTNYLPISISHLASIYLYY